MKNILLIQPSGKEHIKYATKTFLNAESCAARVSRGPLGLEYIGAQMARDYYKVKIILQEDIPNEGLFGEIRKFKPDIIGFTVFTFAAPNTQKICKKIKEYNQKIITVVGGYHPSGYPQIVKDKNIDFAVIGEGEVTFKELVKTLERGGDISGIKGIAYWDDGLKITQPRERIKDLDGLAFPLRAKGLVKKYFFTPIIYSRGCPFGCSFCDSKKIWGNQVVWRSPKNVVREIKEFQKMGARGFYFTDLTFNLNKEKVLELCDEIKREGIKINYSVMGAPRLLDREILERMKESGCRTITCGIETFDPAALKILGGQKRQQALSEIKYVFNLINSVGIDMRNSFMIGYPSDTSKSLFRFKADLKDLYRGIQQSDSPAGNLRISFFTPFPTQPLYEQYKRRGLLLTEDFSKYTSDIPVVKCGVLPKDLIRIRDEIYKEFMPN